VDRPAGQEHARNLNNAQNDKAYHALPGPFFLNAGGDFLIRMDTHE